MSLTHDHSNIIFECDSCHDTVATEQSNIESALNVMRRKEWKPYKVAGEWKHRCPDCQKGSLL